MVVSPPQRGARRQKEATLVEKQSAKHWMRLHLDNLRRAPDGVRVVLRYIKKGDPMLESIKVLAITDFNVAYYKVEFTCITNYLKIFISAHFIHLLLLFNI